MTTLAKRTTTTYHPGGYTAARINIPVKVDMPRYLEETIPSAGHTQQDAIGDLWDNSIDANAINIGVHFCSDKPNKHITRYVFHDDGDGMTLEDLERSMSPAGKRPADGYMSTDLGKYGIGGTIAAFTLGKSKTVLTKTSAGELLKGVLAPTSAAPSAEIEFSLLAPTSEDIALFDYYTDCAEHGTVIIIKNPRKDVASGQQKIDLLKNQTVKTHGERYRKFINGEEKNLTFTVAQYTGKSINPEHSMLQPRKDKIKAIDKTYWHDQSLHKDLRFAKVVKIPGGSVTIRLVHLDPNKFTKSPPASESGIRWMRNNTQIFHGNPPRSGLWGTGAISHPELSYGRVEISFDSSMDPAMGVVNTKNKIAPTQAVIDKLNDALMSFRQAVQRAKKAKPISQTVKQQTQQYLNNQAAKIKASAPTLGYEQASETSYRIPEFQVETKPSDPPWRCEARRTAAGYDLVVYINDADPFIQEYFVKGSDETKFAILTMLNCQYSQAQNYTAVKRSFKVIEEFMIQTAKKVSLHHKILDD